MGRIKLLPYSQNYCTFLVGWGNIMKIKLVPSYAIAHELRTFAKADTRNSGPGLLVEMTKERCTAI